MPAVQRQVDIGNKILEALPQSEFERLVESALREAYLKCLFQLEGSANRSGGNRSSASTVSGTMDSLRSANL